MVSLRTILLLLVLVLKSTRGQSDEDGDVCDATAANECFSDVADDLRFVFDPLNDFFQSRNESALSDLCSAWEDSINCTASIIDDTCQPEEGRYQFDTWNEALRRLIQFMCWHEKSNLRSLVKTVHCWSIMKFIQCTEEEAGLKTVADLLRVKLQGNECLFLQNIVEKCNSKASNPDCRDDGMFATNLLGLSMVAFFDGIECTEGEKSAQNSRASSKNEEQEPQSGLTSGTSPRSKVNELFTLVIFFFVIVFGMI